MKHPVHYLATQPPHEQCYQVCPVTTRLSVPAPCSITDCCHVWCATELYSPYYIIHYFTTILLHYSTTSGSFNIGRWWPSRRILLTSSAPRATTPASRYSSGFGAVVLMALRLQPVSLSDCLSMSVSYPISPSVCLSVQFVGLSVSLVTSLLGRQFFLRQPPTRRTCTLGPRATASVSRSATSLTPLGTSGASLQVLSFVIIVIK